MQPALFRWAAVANRLGRARWLFPLLAALLGGVVLCSTVASGGLPYPRTHDEFAYLLGADTFAHGRLTNPTHPEWEFFETIHEISQPSYATKYQPGTALIMGLAQRITGHPWFGVLAINLALYAALVWCVQAWARPAAALAVVLPVVLTWAGAHYWSVSYWGGALTVLGAALVIGALRRLQQGARGYGWLVGLGVVMLGLTRPAEGAVMLIAAMLAIPRWWRHRRELIVAALICTAGLAFQLAYNRAVTGSVLELPYVVHSKQYSVVPIFWMGSEAPPKVYRTQSLRQEHLDWELRTYRGIADMQPVYRLYWLGNRFLEQLSAVAPVLFWLPLPLLFWNASPMRRLVLAALAGVAYFSLYIFLLPHYFAAWMPLLLVLYARGLTHLATVRWRGMRAGAALAGGLLLVFGVSAGVRAAAEIGFYTDPQRAPFNVGRERNRLEGLLRARPGKHVVFVRYTPQHEVGFEWVFNSAEIDAQNVMWANDRGAENHRLLAYYPDRTFWVLDADVAPLAVRPYPR